MNPLMIGPGVGEDFGNGLVRRVSTASTGGAWCAFEVTLGPGEGVPLHVHARDDEMHYVLEGEIDFQCGDQVFAAQAGAMASLPRGIPHAVRNRSAAPARFLTLFFPGGFDDFVAELNRLRLADAADEAKRDEIRAKYGIRFIRPQSP
ncbi:MAG: cupin domain-containing protein [Planctomycetaceae bacterium]|jgi:quercetin dioxygenase-like cupin family protein|nr:cupin domain-containing protein [Planctomycetaceae bacterium]